MPAPLVVLILMIPALLFGISVAAAKFVARRTPSWIAVLAFPAAWTSIEFAMSRISPHGTALSIAYSQAGFLPVLQSASIAGMWAVTFLLTLVPSAAALAWTRRRFAWLTPALVAGALSLGYGFMRLQERQAEPRIRVGLAAGPDADQAAVFETKDTARALQAARAYADRVTRLASMGAQIVVLPEKLVGVTPENSEAILNIFSTASRDAGLTVVAGFNRIGADRPRNTAIVFAPDGSVQLEYEKHHLLPGPETGYVVGAQPGFFRAAGGRWGTAICKDMDFPGWLRRYGYAGTTLLAVPAWDFVVDARLHASMAIMRCIEDGFSMARSAQQGLLTVSDRHGRIVAECPTSRTADAVLVAELPAGRPAVTFYARTGDWLGWASLAGIIALIGAALIRRSPAH